MQAQERIYTTSDRTEAVAEDDPRAGLLLAAAGQEISAEDAKRYGLKDGRRARPAAPEAEAPAEDETDAEAKAVAGPPATKARIGGVKK